MTSSMAEQNKRVAALIDSIRRSFPVVRYTGDVTQYDARLDDPDFYDVKPDPDLADFWDEKELRDAFKAEVGQRCLETYYSVTPTAMYYLRIRPLSLFFLLGLCAR